MEVTTIDVARNDRARPAAAETQPAPVIPTPVLPKTDAVVLDLRSSGFLPRLEKHIKDYHRGRGNNSRDVGKELVERDHETAGLLAPKDFRNYSAYSTIMPYGKKARYIANVNDAIRLSRTIRQA